MSLADALKFRHCEEVAERTTKQNGYSRFAIGSLFYVIAYATKQSIQIIHNVVVKANFFSIYIFHFFYYI